MMLLTFSAALMLTLPGAVFAECPPEWDQHTVGDDIICLKGSDPFVKVDYATAVAECAALHPQALLVMPKTQEMVDLVNDAIIKLDDLAHPNQIHSSLIGLKPASGHDWEAGTYWADGTQYDLGDFNYFFGGGYPSDTTAEVAVQIQSGGGWGASTKDDNYHYVCQLTNPAAVNTEWSCLSDHHLGSHFPFSHHTHQPAGCQKVLTCGTRVVENGAIVNGLTMKLKQETFGLSADIDMILENDNVVSIAFTEGSSSRSQDDAVVCNSESLGQFLPRHDQVAGLYSFYNSWAGLHGHVHAALHGYDSTPDVDNSQHTRTLVTRMPVTGGVKSKMSIHMVEGFTSLAELAGHGVVVCPSDKVEEKDGVMRCLTNFVPVCCTLGWAVENDAQFLGSPTPTIM